MKKLGIISIALCALVLVGCGNNTKAYEDTMKDYATTYYNAHKKGTVDIEKPTVSIADLKGGNEHAGDNFDLAKLSKCKDSSYVELTIDANRNITGYTFHMECE